MGIALGNTKFSSTSHMTFLTTVLYTYVLLEIGSVSFRSWFLCSWFHSYPVISDIHVDMYMYGVRECVCTYRLNKWYCLLIHVHVFGIVMH